MPDRRRTPAHRRKALSLTSLIDVIFLLLLFFMLSTTFSRQSELPLTTAGAGGAAAADSPVFLRLDGAGLTVNGQPATLPDIAGRVADLSGAAPSILVSLTPEVGAQALADLLATLRRIPAARVQVLG